VPKGVQVQVLFPAPSLASPLMPKADPEPDHESQKTIKVGSSTRDPDEKRRQSANKIKGCGRDSVAIR
jgi:hypothetical protein